MLKSLIALGLLLPVSVTANKYVFKAELACTLKENGKTTQLLLSGTNTTLGNFDLISKQPDLVVALSYRDNLDSLDLGLSLEEVNARVVYKGKTKVTYPYRADDPRVTFDNTIEYKRKFEIECDPAQMKALSLPGDY